MQTSMVTLIAALVLVIQLFYNQTFLQNLMVLDLMHQPFVTTAPSHPHLRGWAGDSRANVRGSDLSCSPAVPRKYRACDINANLLL